MSVVEVTVNQFGPTTSEAKAREHTVLVDRPQAKGGNDKGPMGGEYLLIGLGGCFMSNLLAAVAARDAEVSGVRITISGTLEQTPPRFSKIEMAVIADYQDRDLMQKLLTIAERGCICANTLKNAVDLTVRLVE